MARRGIVQNNYSKGVFDPLLIERVDTQHYYNAMLEGRNVEELPQGGVRRRAALRKRSVIRHKLRRLQLTDAMLTAPNSGNKALLIDQATAVFQTSAVSGDPFVVIEVDLGSAQDVACVDLKNFYASTAKDNVLSVQYSTDDVSYTDVGTDLGIVTLTAVPGRTRRFAFAPGAAVSARYWRVVIKGGAGPGGIFIQEMEFFTETSQRSIVRVEDFTFSVDETYQMVFTDQNIDVFLAGVYKASIPLELRSNQLRRMTHAQSLDTMLVFHEDVPTQHIFRQGGDDEWDSRRFTYGNFPNLGSETSFLEEQTEIQQIAITGINNGETFQLQNLNTLTAAISKSADAGAMATAIASALEATAAIVAGLTVTVSQVDATSITFTIEFTGGANDGRVWPPTYAEVIDHDNYTATTSITQAGRADSGDVVADEAGWPRCGAFFQGRLIVAGAKALPSTIFGSFVGDIDNFSVTASAGGAFEFTLDTEEINVITGLFVGRHLQIFTQTSEWYVVDRSIDASQSVTFVQATRNGVEAGVPYVSADGGTFFVQRNGTVLRNYLFSDVEQDYTAEPISLLASHLMKGVVDVALRRAAETSEGSLIYLTNESDGTMAVLTFDRAQEITAFTEFTTQGLFKAITVDGARRAFAAVERTANSVTEIYLEEFDRSANLDASVAYDFTGSPSASLTGLEHLEGETVWVIADGDPLGEFTVASGAITLSEAVTTAEVGYKPDVLITNLPIRFYGERGQMVVPPLRVFKVAALAL